METNKTESKSLHTKGKWAYGYGGISNSLGIFTKKMLDEGFKESPICLISPTEKMNETDKANAAYIVKCVNGYDTLLEENKRLKEALKGLYDFTLSGKGYLDTCLNDSEHALNKSTVKEDGNNG